MKPRLLIVGGGGREAALAMCLQESWQIVWTGCSYLPKLMTQGKEIEWIYRPIPQDLSQADRSLVQDVAAAIVGPEGALASGWGDWLRGHSIPVLGPTAAMARLETSKIFAKNILEGLPQGRWREIKSIQDVDWSWEDPWVIKQDGLAAGKGVLVSSSREQVQNFVRDALGSGKRLLQEEFLRGEELSVTALVSRGNWVLLPGVRDHKQRYPGNQGPMTGGMGIVAPVSTHPQIESILQQLIERIPNYEGFLFVGFMVGEQGPKILEINCRLGDPEVIGILATLKDPCRLFQDYFQGRMLGFQRAETHPSRWVVAMTVAAPEYPEGTGVLQTAGLPFVWGREQWVVPASLESCHSQDLDWAGGRLFHSVGMASSKSEAYRRALSLVRHTLSEGALTPPRPLVRLDIGQQGRRVVIAASGRGSNAQVAWQALHRAGWYHIHLLANRPLGPVVSLASSQLGMSCQVIEGSRENFQRALALQLRPGDFVLALGFDKIFRREFFQNVPQECWYAPGVLRGWNIHPSLLPQFPGLGAYQKAWSAVREGNLSRHGCTLHWLTEGVDEGPIVAQASFPVDEQMSLAELEALGLAHEHQLVGTWVSKLVPWLWQERSLDDCLT